MTDFARLVLDADTRGLKQGERDLQGVGDQAKRTAKDVDGAASGMTSAFKKVGVALVAAGIGEVLYDFGKQSVQAAIDAQEMDSAFEVVFGNMAENVRAWAEETGNALGRSTQELQRGALAFQELFGKALAPSQAAELSKQFAVLTQDLASFKNLSNEVAQQKLFSGLVGESEPLRAVGVFLDEAALKARAAAMGMGDFSKELTAQEKIVVRAAEIQAQLAMANGDVERTGGSTANQIKTMNAAVEELQVAVGQKLLPQLTPLITVTAELVTMMANAAQAINVSGESTRNFVTGLRVLAEYASRAASAFGRFTGAIGVTGEYIYALYQRTKSLLNPLSGVISLIERVGAARTRQNNVESLLGPNADFSTNFIAGELAAFKGLTTAANDLVPPMAAVGVAASGTGKQLRGAGSDAKKASDDFQQLYDRLFPFQAAMRQLEADEKLIMGNKELTEARKEEMLAALEQERFRSRTRGLGDAPISRGLLGTGPIVDAKKELDATLKGLAAQAKTQTVTVADSFAQMSERIVGSLQGLTNSIRSGDFLGILGGVLNVFTQLGSAGVFGKSIQTNLNKPVAGARAMGGQVNAGRTYLVGERGPELFTPQGHGRIVSNDNMRSGMTFNIDARGATDPAAIRQQVQQGILEAAPSIVAAAEQRTISTLRRPRLAGVM